VGCVYLSFVLHAPLIFRFITLIIFGQHFKRGSSSFCTSLQSPPPTSSCLLGPNIVLSTLFSNTQYWGTHTKQ
jgi:hypothetical protein